MILSKLNKPGNPKNNWASQRELDPACRSRKLRISHLCSKMVRLWELKRESKPWRCRTNKLRMLTPSRLPRTISRLQGTISRLPRTSRNPPLSSQAPLFSTSRMQCCLSPTPSVILSLILWNCLPTRTLRACKWNSCWISCLTLLDATLRRSKWTLVLTWTSTMEWQTSQVAPSELQTALRRSKMQSAPYPLWLSDNL